MAQVHVTKRGNLFQYRFEIAPQGGTRKYINKSGFKTKQEAYEVGMKAYNEYSNVGHSFKPSTMSFADCLDCWMKNYFGVNLRDNTIQAYINIINNYLKININYILME